MKMELRHMGMLREIQAICKEKMKDDCSNCPFFIGTHCLFVLNPKYWELDKFEVEG